MLAVPRSPTAESAAARTSQELAAQEARHGPRSAALLPVLERLAQTKRRDGKLAEATTLRRRALDIVLAAGGAGSPRGAAAMAALAESYLDRRRYLDAEPLLIIARRVLADRAPQGDALASIDAGLARIALARGETAEAVNRARRAVETARRGNGATAEPLRVLGAALTAAGRFAEAEPVLREALARDRARPGGETPETARSLSELANLQLRAGRPDDALRLLQEAAAIDQMLLGPAHPFIADDLHDLGIAYEALGRSDEARRALLASVALLERGDGRETPRVAYAELELSRLYRRQGDDAAAEAAFRDARRILNKAEAEERRRERRA